MESERIEGTVYTHPIGDVMHAAGPNIGLADQDNGPLAASGNFELHAEVSKSSTVSKHSRSKSGTFSTMNSQLNVDPAFAGDCIVVVFD